MINLAEITTYYINAKVLINIYQISSIKYSSKFETYCITMNNGDTFEIENDDLIKIKEAIKNDRKLRIV